MTTSPRTFGGDKDYMRILIADDDRVSCMILSRAVVRLGHEVLVAGDGQEAWSLFQTANVDVIISDWMMPDVDGIELCRRVRAAARDVYPYFILLTGLSDKANQLTGMQAGADDYLTKPLDRDELEMRLITAQRVTVLYRQVAEQRAEGERLFRRAEEARTDLRAMFDSTSEAVLLIAPDGRIRDVNRRFGELFGLDAAAIVGRATADRQPEFARIFDLPAGLAAIVEQRAASEAPLLDVVQHWPQRRILAVFSAPVATDGGDHLGQIYAFRDVTREREVETMKSELVSLVSHELRTPLTSIKGYVDLVLNGEAGPVPEIQREFLGVARENADRLVAMINELLDLSRIEAGKVELRLGPVDLAPLIAGVARAMRPQLVGKRQTLDLELAAPLPLVHADANRVTQILTNLVSNAHKYTLAGGAISLCAQPEDGMVRVEIRDTGVGMSPEDLAHLFQKFFRAQHRAAQDVGGTGLGLAITRSLVELHGGTMRVTSVLNQGSAFSFTLPVAHPASET